MKTHVLIVPRVFPQGHPKAGEQTGIVEKLQSGAKIHILMEAYETWRQRVKEVREGKAILSIRYRAGNSEKAKQVEIMKVGQDNSDYLEVRRLEWRADYVAVASHMPHLAYNVPYSDIASNEGFSEEDFRALHKDADPREPMALIHLTPFRY
jgi:hypothetical protein